MAVLWSSSACFTSLLTTSCLLLLYNHLSLSPYFLATFPTRISDHADLSVDTTTALVSDTHAYPDLFIYRRTKKTGSSSMREALLVALEPYGYRPIPYRMDSLAAILHQTYLRPSSTAKRIILIQHNSITRDIHSRKNAVIADTIRNGFARITSHCRHVQHVQTCGEDMIQCLQSNVTFNEIYFPWAGQSHENFDNYIDLPLSSAHPALSTAVIRTVFPNLTLHMHKYNLRSTACEETLQLRHVYNKYYSLVDKQVATLQRRMLTLAGYPTSFHDENKNYTLDDMLDAAERIHTELHPELATTPEFKQSASKTVLDFRGSFSRWYVDSNDLLQVDTQRTINSLHKDTQS